MPPHSSRTVPAANFDAEQKLRIAERAERSRELGPVLDWHGQLAVSQSGGEVERDLRDAGRFRLVSLVLHHRSVGLER